MDVLSTGQLVTYRFSEFFGRVITFTFRLIRCSSEVSMIDNAANTKTPFRSTVNLAEQKNKFAMHAFKRTRHFKLN